ncbi:VOC family protein [Arthrobacter sp. ISL-30]|uniref:VOC family protein n=1 Tax=Arthrobacter sp. ISL-30 TaxID=2819109 RepID=UPI001BEBF9DE|nr:VOC family protein [Arthrobacter sp. ISL-30]MBT2513359.1 VOC family protein [Arthrobacter sp. ISL-30]
MTKADPIISTVPAGYSSVSPWIISRNTDALFTFMTKAFGAKEIDRVVGEDGSIGHAEARIADSVVLAFDSRPHWPETPAYLRLYIDDADAAFAAALAAGGRSVSELDNSAWGDRGGRIQDPLGNVWWIMSHMEVVSEDEAARRWQAPEYAAGMSYAIDSLDRHMTGRENRREDVPELVRNMTAPPRAEGVRPVPEGYRSVEPWIISRDTAGVLDFITAAFGAQEAFRVPMEDGSIGHAEARIGDSNILAFDSRPNWPPTPAFLRLYVDDGDATFAAALAAGATAVTNMTEMFWGERVGRVRDPFGNLWWIHCRVAELTAEEAYERAARPEFVQAMEYVTGSEIMTPGKD